MRMKGLVFIPKLRPLRHPKPVLLIDDAHS
jgi:hypothetical protein